MQPVICLEMLYPDLDHPVRIERIASFGFSNVEFWSWRDKNIPEVISVCDRFGVRVVNFSGHRKGSLVAMSTHPTFFSELTEAVAVAQQLQCPTLMLLTNELGSGGRIENRFDHLSHQERYENVCQGLGRVIAETPATINLVVEPLNTVLDHPGYFLDDIEQAIAIIEAVNHPRLQLLCDLYHLAVMGYDPVETVREYTDHIGYVHIADYPGRHEPGRGEGDWLRVLQVLHSKGYEGYVGFEYSPYHDTDASLTRIRELWSAFEAAL